MRGEEVPRDYVFERGDSAAEAGEGEGRGWGKEKGGGEEAREVKEGLWMGVISGPVPAWSAPLWEKIALGVAMLVVIIAFPAKPSQNEAGRIRKLFVFSAVLILVVWILLEVFRFF